MSQKISTLKMSREDWLKERQRGIGSSDVASILGLSPWRTALDVFNEKTDPQPSVVISSPKMEMGLAMEPVISKVYSERTGAKIWRDNFIRIHPEFQFMIADIDRWIRELGNNIVGVMEIKNSTHLALSKWDGQIPPYYFAQVQHQLLVTGKPWAKIVFMLDGWDIKDFHIEANREYHEFLIEEERDFWTNHILKKIPPEPQTPEEVKQAYRHSIGGSVVEATPETFVVYEDLKRVKEKLKELEEEESILKANLQKIMKDNEILMFDGNVLATWKTENRNDFNKKQFKLDNPDLYQKYLVNKEIRKFLPK